MQRTGAGKSWVGEVRHNPEHLSCTPRTHVKKPGVVGYIPVIPMPETETVGVMGFMF